MPSTIQPVTLGNHWMPFTSNRDFKAEPKLARMELIRQSRLSVAPVRDEKWATILKMAES